jgi:hypothetical protein
MQILTQQPNSPQGAFRLAVESLQDILNDREAKMNEIADAFVKVLDLLDCIPVQKSIYAAVKAVLVSNFRAIAREFLDGSTALDTRRGASKDIDIHSKRVLGHAWL